MSLVGTSNLPVAPRSTPWNAKAAKARVFEACGGNVACISRAFLWRSDGDARSPEVYSLGFADVIDGRLHIIPKGLAACAGTRGVGAFSGAEPDEALVRARLNTIYDRVRRDIEDWPDSPFASITADASGQAFQGVIAIEGEATGDGRFIEKGALTWPVLPVPLVFDRENMDHSGATIGTINAVERRDDGTIWAQGNLSDSDDPETQLLVLRAAELFNEGAVGVSVSLDDTQDNLPEDPEAEWPDVVRITAGRLRSVAIVDEAAIIDSRVALAAALRPSLPQAFANPKFGGESPTNPQENYGDERLVWQEPERPEEVGQYGCPLVINADGSYYGHAALWNRCHVGYPGTCVRPPKEPAAYRGYLTGERIPGVPTGPLVMKTTHASLKVGAVEAKDHYDHTGYALGDNVIGPDIYGIYVAGQLRADATEADVEVVRGSALSGDWRVIGAQMRLVGLLVVNAPGFRVSRAMAASGAMLTVGPGCDLCDESESLESRVEKLEALIAGLVPEQIPA